MKYFLRCFTSFLLFLTPVLLIAKEPEYNFSVKAILDSYKNERGIYKSLTHAAYVKGVTMTLKLVNYESNKQTGKYLFCLPNYIKVLTPDFLYGTLIIDGEYFKNTEHSETFFESPFEMIALDRLQKQYPCD